MSEFITKKQPSSTLVTITDQLELKLIEIITNNYKPSTSELNDDDGKSEISKDFSTKCESYIANADALNLIRTILKTKDAMNTLFQLDPIDDCISSFSILCNLLSKLDHDNDDNNKGDANASMDICKEVVSVISSRDYDIDVSKRIVLLFTLYNLRCNGNEKCYLLSCIIALCSSTPSSSLLLLQQQHQQHSSVISSTTVKDDIKDNDSAGISSSSLVSDMIQVDRINQVLTEWDVDVSNRQLLFKSIVDAMKKITLMGGNDACNATTAAATDADEEDEKHALSSDDIYHAQCMRQKYLLLIIETHADSSKVDKLVLEYAEEASLGAIRDPITLFNEQRGMLGYQVIKKLQSTNKPLYDLLNIFQVGTLEDYQTFLNKNPNAFTALNLVQDDCLRHIRLLTFLSLASQGYKEIPYKTVADKLQIPLDDVESWVISAVSYNLVTAKMDQLEEVVMVEKYLVRSFGFGTQEWKELHMKLLEWKDHVKFVLDGLKECDNVQSQVLSTTTN